MGRSHKGERVGLTVRVSRETVARVDAFAERERLDRSSALSELIERGLDGEGAASSPQPSSSAKSAGLAADLADRDKYRPRRRHLVGFDASSGAPIYREA